MSKHLLVICTLISILLNGCTSEPSSQTQIENKRDPGCDMVFLNGKIATVDSDFSIQTAMAIKGDRIEWVGSKEEAKSYIGDETRVIKFSVYDQGLPP